MSDLSKCLSCNEPESRSLYIDDNTTVFLHKILGFDPYVPLTLSTLRTLHEEMEKGDTLSPQTVGNLRLHLGAKVLTQILASSSMSEECECTHSALASFEKYSVFKLKELFA